MQTQLTATRDPRCDQRKAGLLVCLGAPPPAPGHVQAPTLGVAAGSPGQQVPPGSASLLAVPSWFGLAPGPHRVPVTLQMEAPGNATSAALSPHSSSTTYTVHVTCFYPGGSSSTLTGHVTTREWQRSGWGSPGQNEFFARKDGSDQQMLRHLLCAVPSQVGIGTRTV